MGLLELIREYVAPPHSDEGGRGGEFELPADMTIWPSEWREHYEELSGKYEHEAGMPEHKATLKAHEDTRQAIMRGDLPAAEDCTNRDEPDSDIKGPMPDEETPPF